MDVEKLYSTLKMHLDINKEIGSYPVLVTLSDPGVGARASVGVRYVGPGFDWEHRQFRIEPEDKIFRNIQRLDQPIGIVREEFGGLSFNACSRCHRRVSQSDKYCRHCGQRLK